MLALAVLAPLDPDDDREASFSPRYPRLPIHDVLLQQQQQQQHEK